MGAAWAPAAGAISFRGISMRYDADLPLVLKGVSFEVAAGSKVGVVGRTGAGKTSLVLALFRMMMVEDDGGSIAIDGRDIATVSVRVAFGTGIVRGMRFAELEFEWAAPPRPRALVTSRDAYAPASATDAAALELVSGAFGDLARSSLREPAMPFFVASGTGRAFAGLNATRAYADADDMDPGGAWWHGDGAPARLAAPTALAGADFRDGAGLRARFSAVAAEASAAVAAGFAHERSVVRAWFVSSALILVEPPAMPPRVADEPDDVLVGVSVDGGATFSDAAAAHRVARARAGHAR